MNAKEAVAKALAHTQELFSGEDISNVGLEEVRYEADDRAWRITVGFSRPWDYPKQSVIEKLADTPLTARPPNPEVPRTYKIVTIDDESQEAISLESREDLQ